MRLNHLHIESMGMHGRNVVIEQILQGSTSFNKPYTESYHHRGGTVIAGATICPCNTNGGCNQYLQKIGMRLHGRFSRTTSSWRRMCFQQGWMGRRKLCKLENMSRYTCRVIWIWELPPWYRGFEHTYIMDLRPAVAHTTFSASKLHKPARQINFVVSFILDISPQSTAVLSIYTSTAPF